MHSALSLRLFGIDITVAGVAAQQQKNMPASEQPDNDMEGEELEKEEEVSSSKALEDENAS